MRRPGVAAVAVSVAAVILLAALFAGDSVWTGIAALGIAGAWGALALLGRAPSPRGGGIVLAAALALAAWSGLSVVWSVAPDRSWDELNRTLVAAAFLGVGLLAGAAAGPRRAAQALALALGAAIAWALAGKAIPALFEDGGRAARLREPIGYWNALALAADAALVLGLWLAASWRRTAGVALAYGAVVAVLLAASRAGVGAAVIGVAVWVWLRRDRIEAALLAVAAALPAVLVAAWAFTRDALVEDGQPRADRVADGAWFGLLLLAGAALAVALAGRALRLDRRRTGVVLRWGAVAAAGLALALVALNAGRIADEFRGGEVPNDPGRFTSLSSNNRSAWWGEAWDVFRAEPLLGAGANTFQVARKRYRETASQVTQPHSVPLQFLAGTGVVGLALLAALIAAAATAAVGAVRRLEGGEREAAVALAAVPELWLLHALVDYDWDFLAVTGPALFAVGVLAASGRELVFQKHKARAAAAVAVAATACVSLLTPWLAERSVREVGDALGRGDSGAALAAAERAASLDPLALDPLFAEARVHEVERDFGAALATYREAAQLQPENPESLYQLGLFEFSRGDRCSAYTHLNDAYTLDPAGQQWSLEPRALDLAREWVNAGNCS
jgi:tetratricopeptide (TPR) repeat protein